MSTEQEHLIQAMKKAALLLGYTNRDLERKLGLSNSYLSRLFSGEMELRFDRVVAIAEAMGLKASELVRAALPLTGPPTEAFRCLTGLCTLSPPPAAPAAIKPLNEEELERVFEKLLRKFVARLARDEGEDAG